MSYVLIRILRPLRVFYGTTSRNISTEFLAAKGLGGAERIHFWQHVLELRFEAHFRHGVAIRVRCCVFVGHYFLLVFIVFRLCAHVFFSFSFFQC